MNLQQMAHVYLAAERKNDPRCAEVLRRLHARFPTMDVETIQMRIQLIAMTGH